MGAVAGATTKEPARNDVEMAAADVGVAVSREEIMASIERADTPTTTAATAPAAGSHPRSISLPTNPLPARLETLTDAKSQPRGTKTAPASKEPSSTPSLARPSKKQKLSRQDNEDDDEEITDYFAKGKASAKKPPSSASSTPRPPPSEQSLQPGEKRPKSTTPAAPQPTSKESTTNPDRPKKKKSQDVGKTVKGDEFDDIFGSLDTKKKKDKTTKPKKRRKGGDEFDDIFGGL